MTESGSGFQRILSELKRRRVFRVAAVYAVVAWAVLQVGDVVVEPLRLPAWTMTLLIVLALAGFPFALALAWMFDVTPEGVRREHAAGPSEHATGRSGPGPILSLRGRRSVWFALGMLVVLSGAWFALGPENDAGAGDLDADAVAVLPFRTAGAAPELQYLREGMLDLLAAKLTGEAGPRAVDPRSTMSLWRRSVPTESDDLPRNAAIAVARDLGAGQLLLGGVVGTAENLTMSAEVVAVPDGVLRARAVVDGPADSIPILVDRLAAQLLAREAGQAEDRIAALADIPLPAVRAYLAGEAALRIGRWQEAAEHLEGALQIDSTFALAALALHSALGWAHDVAASGESRSARALRLAWAARKRLSERDRLRFEAMAGPEYPDPSPPAAEIDSREAAVAAAPDNPQLWFLLGDSYYHRGARLGYTDWLDRARAAFARAIALDSAHAAPLLHLTEIALLERDTATVRRLTDVLLARETEGETAVQLRWFRAVVLGDSTTRAEMRSRFDELDPHTLRQIAHASAGLGIAMADADTAARVLYQGAGSAAERSSALYLRARIAINRGRPAEAMDFATRIGEITGDPDYRRFQQLLSGVYRTGNPDSAAAAAADLAYLLDAPLASDPTARVRQLNRMGWVGLWRFMQGGDTATIRTAIRRIHAAVADGIAPPMLATAAYGIGAAVEAYGPGPAEAQLAILDSIGRTETGPAIACNWFAAWLHELHGSPEAALAAVRRNDGGLLWMRSSHLREEGRLAALTGDTAGAIRAYRRYLAMHDDPEPAVRAEVEQVRRDLAVLVGREAF